MMSAGMKWWQQLWIFIKLWSISQNEIQGAVSMSGFLHNIAQAKACIESIAGQLVEVTSYNHTNALRAKPLTEVQCSIYNVIKKELPSWCGWRMINTANIIVIAHVNPKALQFVRNLDIRSLGLKVNFFPKRLRDYKFPGVNSHASSSTTSFPVIMEKFIARNLKFSAGLFCENHVSLTTATSGECKSIRWVNSEKQLVRDWGLVSSILGAHSKRPVDDRQTDCVSLASAFEEGESASKPIGRWGVLSIVASSCRAVWHTAISATNTFT